MKDKKILFVDDEPWFMTILFDLIDKECGLGKHDYVSDGSAALKSIKIYNYSLIILDLIIPLGKDITLPKNEPDLMYGIYILRKIREFDSKVPILCYTTLNEDEIIKQINLLNSKHLCKLEDDSFNSLMKQIKKYLS